MRIALSRMQPIRAQDGVGGRWLFVVGAAAGTAALADAQDPQMLSSDFINCGDGKWKSLFDFQARGASVVLKG